MQDNLKQVFEKIKDARHIFAEVQTELKNKRIEVETGAGLVKIVVNGTQEIIEIHIDPELIQMKDAKLLEDLVKSAVNEAMQKAQKEAQTLMQQKVGFGIGNLKNLLSGKNE
ncbi:YbaB/EbfC family nucleoid-associated protein [candidate division WOR-3 bacterium]|nr:YbaB/EbfC family nucleoid-associated protein [candidate division WOR-3 bacterium]